MDELIDYRCVDFQKLLILKAKSLQLSDQQCYVLLLIMTLDEIGVKPITPLQISKICSLSVQKLDDILMSHFSSPRLTTIHQGVPEKGILAVQQLLRQIRGEIVEEKDIRLPVRIVERESVKTLIDSSKRV